MEYDNGSIVKLANETRNKVYLKLYGKIIPYSGKVQQLENVATTKSNVSI